MKNFIFIILSVILMANTCRKPNPDCKNGHFSFTFKNNSQKKIITNFYFETYPDTIIGQYNPLYGGKIISPFEQTKKSSGPGLLECWETLLKNNKKEFLYIFDADSLKVIPWDTVRDTNRGLLERREINLQYLIDRNFVITYP